MDGFKLHRHQRPQAAQIRAMFARLALLRSHSPPILSRAADGLRLRDIARAVPVTHAMFHAHARHIEKDRYK